MASRHPSYHQGCNVEPPRNGLNPCNIALNPHLLSSSRISCVRAVLTGSLSSNSVAAPSDEKSLLLPGDCDITEVESHSARPSDQPPGCGNLDRLAHGQRKESVVHRIRYVPSRSLASVLVYHMSSVCIDIVSFAEPS